MLSWLLAAAPLAQLSGIALPARPPDVGRVQSCATRDGPGITRTGAVDLLRMRSLSAALNVRRRGRSLTSGPGG